MERLNLMLYANGEGNSFSSILWVEQEYNFETEDLARGSLIVLDTWLVEQELFLT